MPKFKVTIQEIVLYEVEIEAKTTFDASDLALDQFINDPAGPSKYLVSVQDRQTVRIDELPTST